MLWSWFADDDFRYLSDRNIGVGYLALSLQFENQNGVVPYPRRNPIRIAPQTYTMAVVRFDYSLEHSRPSFSPKQRELAVKMIAEIVTLAHPQALQIDFDAPRSAHPFYRELLKEVRQRIGPDVFLSMTALASWCGAEQSWLAGLPVDELVPMTFYMGRYTTDILTDLQRNGKLGFPACSGSLGIEFRDSQVPTFLAKDQRIYFFRGSNQWTQAVVLQAKKALLP